MSSLNDSSLSSRIREQARNLGFLKIGIASARPPLQDQEFKKWLNEGMHGEMHYLEYQASKRLNPDLVLPGARSIVLLAMNYYTMNPPDDSSLKGRISRYAWGDDYHALIMGRLEILLEYILKQRPSAQGRCYVDTGPVMEKAWGSQTALGWVGKHTNLVTRNHGSWFFIGVILLDIDLEWDFKEKDFCGTCRRCITACPTGAIVAPYILDARLCISYLTIELRGPIPRHLRLLIGNRIFGCDDCQEVCPWNRFAVKSSERGFSPREGSLMPELAPLVRLTPREFEDRFRHSPIRRATRECFVRNVVVALGNSLRADAIPALEEALQDSSHLVRMHASWGLGRTATRQSRRILERARLHESNSAVLEEMDSALASHKRDKGYSS